MAWLIHSAKGSSWKHPMYVKKEGTPGKLEEDGKYYYPDSYKGGRHLPKNGKDNRATGEHKNKYPDDMEEWEKKVHDHLSGIIEKHPDLFKTGTDVAKGIMDPNNFQAVKNTLKAFGLPVDKMSDDDIKKLRRKIADAYDDKYQSEEPKVSSKKKQTKKAESTTEENKTEEKSSDSKKKSAPSETSRVTMAGNEAAKKKEETPAILHHSAWIAHHGILGMHWGKRNGPPYPLGFGDHSASEKKAGWRKSLGSGSHSTPRKKTKDLSDDELKTNIQRLSLEKKYNQLNSEQNKSKLEKARDAVNEISNTTNRITNTISNSKPKNERMDLSDKSDQELRNKINREILEMQYSDLFGQPSKIESGKEKAAKILKGVSNALSITSSALTVALLMKSLSKS